MGEVARRGIRVRGYAFYHSQDTDRVVDGDGLYLNYGATAEGEAPALGVAREIVDCLQRHGLATSWSGSWKQRIGVTLEWRRRRSDRELARHAETHNRTRERLRD